MKRIFKPLLERPYSERQLIVVAADDIIKLTQEVLAEATSPDESSNWSKISKLALKFLTGNAAEILAEMTIEAITAWTRMRENGFPVTIVSRSDTEMVQFPPGHPRDGILYVGHPAIPSIYYTPALFHRLCFEHKFSEAVQLLMGLGATHISVEHISGWSKEFSANLSVPLGAVDVGAKAGSISKAASQLLYKATFSGTARPKVPTGLVWYPHEPTWQQIAQGRLEYGLHNFSLSVRYEDDYGINAGLKTVVQKSGLDLGGKFEDHQSTVWRVEGEFLPSKPRKASKVRAT